MSQDALNKAALILQNTLKESLLRQRESRTYYGATKPTSGAYPTPISSKIASGGLYDSIEVYPEFDYERGYLKMIVEMASYGKYVDQGRRPNGKYPPLGAIDRWVLQKPGFGNLIRNAQGQFISRKSLVFLVRRSIARDGIYPTKFIERSIEETLDTIYNSFEQASYELIEDLVRQARIEIEFKTKKK
jgi:hypothetical protein